MRLSLTPHPLSCSTAVDRIDVELERSRPDQLRLSYVVTGCVERLAVPQLAAPQRRAELWQHTCFEAFMRTSDEPHYYEFNFSPSTEWAVYRFDGYRTNMREALEIDAVHIDWSAKENSCTLEAHLKVGSIPDLTRAVWQVGLSAIIEEHSGAKSYWSLMHPSDKPDFHHPAGFIHEIVPREI